MSWIKRNLSLVISGVVALGLLGFGGFYLWRSMDRNTQVDTEINQTKAEIERLLNMDPTPSQSNLTNAKRELERLNSFVAEAKKQFPPSPVPGTLNALSFKSLLQNSVEELHRQAATVGIKVPTNPPDSTPYYFTFEAERLPVTFPPDSLRPLSERLHDIQQLASILFKAHINRLEGMRRAPVGGEMYGSGSTDYLGVSVVTNMEAGVVLWPYEVAFECFTSELAAVLEAMQNTPGVIVRFPVVEPAETTLILRKAPAPPIGQPRRVNAPVAPPPPAGLVTIVNEKLLHVTLRLEVIKPVEFTRPGPRRP